MLVEAHIVVVSFIRLCVDERLVEVNDRWGLMFCTKLSDGDSNLEARTAA